jgi:Protein of unknown function (DUF1496)
MFAFCDLEPVSISPAMPVGMACNKGCYFNDALYPDGSHVRSGSTYLRCERGMWVEVESQVREVA